MLTLESSDLIKNESEVTLESHSWIHWTQGKKSTRGLNAENLSSLLHFPEEKLKGKLQGKMANQFLLDDSESLPTAVWRHGVPTGANHDIEEGAGPETVSTAYQGGNWHQHVQKNQENPGRKQVHMVVFPYYFLSSPSPKFCFLRSPLYSIRLRKKGDFISGQSQLVWCHSTSHDVCHRIMVGAVSSIVGGLIVSVRLPPLAPALTT